MSDLKIAVSGASGLVGSNLVSYLANKGYDVVAIVRSLDKVAAFSPLWQPKGVKIVEADITDQNALRKAIEGRDVVVHAAGVVDPYGSRKAIFAVNVEGTRMVLNLAKQLHVKQLVFVSSLSVITGQCDQWNVTETAPVRHCGEAYADSKVEAELLVMSEAGKGEIAVTAVRPGFIYGPGERSWLPRLIDSIAGRKAALIDGGAKQTNVIYVENLNRAIEGTFLNPKAYGSVYNLTDGEVISKKELFDAIADGLGLPRVTRVVPGFVVKLVVETVSTLAPFLPVENQRKLARYSRGAFRLAGLNQGFSIGKAEAELNYVDRVPFKQGMAATLASFKATKPVRGLVGCAEGEQNR